jgi:proline dehydrogenase
MLRSLFVNLSGNAFVRKLVTRWPFAWRMASRFVAGENIEDAIRVIKQLNSKGIYATLDHLGEHTMTIALAVDATQAILCALDSIKKTAVQANVSIKLTQIGLNIDEELCAQNLKKILDRARNYHNFVRVDMEDSALTERTIALVRHMWMHGYDNIGTVIQSYLYRSGEDIQLLAAAGIPVRLCKGAYSEPPEVAYPRKSDVDQSYDRLGDVLLNAVNRDRLNCVEDSGIFPPLPAFATHDEHRIEIVKERILALDLPKRCLEFQMLNGIRRDLQENLIQDGYAVRVYVPYGSEWYPYFMRRLAERPANLWFLLTNLLRH